MVFEPIAEKIENAGAATGGVDLFIDQMPQGVSGVLLKDSMAGTRRDLYTDFRKGQFDLIVRDVGYQSCLARIEEITKIVKSSGETRGNMLIRNCLPLNEPISYPISDGRMLEMRVTFLINYSII